MTEGRFVSYLRVSTGKQGKSGLGLEAQRETVRQTLNGGDWQLLAEFVEVEGGRVSDRPQLAAALDRCRLMGAKLIVANVSRLTRNPDFMSRLAEAGVDVWFCDLPRVEGPVGKFMLRQMLAVAELEAGFIGERTRKALAAAKARGVKLGGNRGNLPAVSDKGREISRRVRMAKAQDRVKLVAPVIAELRASGATSLRQIADALNARSIPTPRGATWQPAQVKRLLERL
jgi:DNA invertase Pin-like site-specific DNA recombinase